MPYGYMGKILRIDLTDKTIKEESITEDLYRKYIGGVGLSAYYLLNETDEKTDPLGPDNRLIFMTGPFTLNGVPSSGRHSVVAKSPLTGIWGEADVGGTWGIELKKCGYDGMIVQGKSKEPVYILIQDSNVKLINADNIWGKDTYITDEILKKEYGDNIKVQSIGTAGENLVKISSICTDGKSARVAARCGLGAVMGSKKLKAVIVKGSNTSEVYNKDMLKKEIREIAKSNVENRGGMYEHGTGGDLLGNELSGDLPIKNWKLGLWDNKSKKITSEVLTQKYLTDRYFCGNCAIGCGREIKIDSGKYAGVEGAGPEYETLGMIGSNLLIDDMEVICKANELCNRYGIDTISLGGIAGFAMECFEHGLITENDTNGVKLEWGNGEALIALIEMIVNKEHIGKALSEGVKKTAEKLGGLALEFAIEAKGLELPAHEARILNGTALSYATSNRGACHNADLNSRFFEKALTMPEIGINEPRGTLTVEGKGEMVAKLQDVSGLYDCLKICKFMVCFGMTTTKLLELLNLITGWDMTMDEFLEVGERSFNLRRLYNVKCGISRKDDTLPPRILCQPRGEGADADHIPPLNIMLRDYYKARGWNDLGIPVKETLNKLGIIEFK